jgi:Flp pilus assembly protein TadB
MHCNMFHYISHLFLYIHNVTQQLTAWIVKEQAVVARQRYGNHVFAAMNKYATTVELLEAVFFVWSAQAT